MDNILQLVDSNVCLHLNTPFNFNPFLFWTSEVSQKNNGLSTNFIGDEPYDPKKILSKLLKPYNKKKWNNICEGRYKGLGFKAFQCDELDPNPVYIILFEEGSLGIDYESCDQRNVKGNYKGNIKGRFEISKGTERNENDELAQHMEEITGSDCCENFGPSVTIFHNNKLMTLITSCDCHAFMTIAEKPSAEKPFCWVSSDGTISEYDMTDVKSALKSVINADYH
jgi:hypothetical protein